MAQQQRALVALAKGLGSIPNTYMETPVLGNLMLCPPQSKGIRHEYGMHIHIHRQILCRQVLWCTQEEEMERMPPQVLDQNCLHSKSQASQD